MDASNQIELDAAMRASQRKMDHIWGSITLLCASLAGTEEDMETTKANVWAREEFYEAGPA